MVENVVRALDVSVHHRRCRLESLAMGLSVDVEPGRGPALLGFDALAYPFRQDFGAAPRKCGLPRLLQERQNLRYRLARDIRDGADLGRSEVVRGNSGESAHGFADQRQVVLEWQ